MQPRMTCREAAVGDWHAPHLPIQFPSGKSLLGYIAFSSSHVSPQWHRLERNPTGLESDLRLEVVENRVKPRMTNRHQQN
ncbi:hypothetical protein SLA2020_398340 [Shorea laevis]